MKNLKKLTRIDLKDVFGGKRNPYEHENQITICYNILYCYTIPGDVMGSTGIPVQHVGTTPPEGAHNPHPCGWTPAGNMAGCV